MMHFLVDGCITTDAPPDGIEDNGTILLTQLGRVKKTVIGKYGAWKLMSCTTHKSPKITFKTKGDLIKHYGKHHRILLNGIPVKQKTKSGGFKLFSRSW